MKKLAFKQQLAVQIGLIREAFCYSPREMAKLTGTDLQTYLDYEAGVTDPPVEFIYHFSSALQFSPAYMFTPENKLDVHGDVKFIPPDQEAAFQDDPLVRESRLDELAQWFLQRPGDGLQVMGQNPFFSQSKLIFGFSTIEKAYLNPTAQTIFATMDTLFKRDQPRYLSMGRAVLWGALHKIRPRYLTILTTYPKATEEQHLFLRFRCVLMAKENQLYLLWVDDPLTYDIPNGVPTIRTVKPTSLF